MSSQRNGKGIMLIKVDLEKAYDRLSWQIIRYKLHTVDLPTIWIRNIMQCVETPIMALNWNWETSGLVCSLSGDSIRGFHLTILIYAFCPNDWGMLNRIWFNQAVGNL